MRTRSRAEIERKIEEIQNEIDEQMEAGNDTLAWVDELITARQTLEWVIRESDGDELPVLES